MWKNKARTEVVCLGRKRVQSFDPASGKPLWELSGMNGQAMASPTASDDLLFAGTGGQLGGGRPLFAVKAGASGDVTPKRGATSNEGVAWSLPKAGPLVATPLLYEGNLYVLEQSLGDFSLDLLDRLVLLAFGFGGDPLAFLFRSLLLLGLNLSLLPPVFDLLTPADVTHQEQGRDGQSHDELLPATEASSQLGEFVLQRFELQ